MLSLLVTKKRYPIILLKNDSPRTDEVMSPYTIFKKENLHDKIKNKRET